jgi:hypothetical protein
MVHFAHRKKSNHGSTSNDVMKEAVEEINDGKPIHQAAKDYSTPYPTL